MGRLFFIATVLVLAFVGAVIYANSPSGWAPGWLGGRLTIWRPIDKRVQTHKAQMGQVFDNVHEQRAMTAQRAKDNMAFEKDHSLPGIVTGALQGDPRTISPSVSADARFDPEYVYAQSREIARDAKERQERLKQQQQDQMRDQSKK